MPRRIIVSLSHGISILDGTMSRKRGHQFIVVFFFLLRAFGVRPPFGEPTNSKSPPGFPNWGDDFPRVRTHYLVGTRCVTFPFFTSWSTPPWALLLSFDISIFLLVSPNHVSLNNEFYKFKRFPL